jgi:predicted AlkP superfamily pyrophosphatase or phosphodiesterase
MRSIVFFIFLLLTLQVSARQKKAIFVIVDGISADLIEKLSTPNLDAIAAEGGYTRALAGGERGDYSQTPTISAVGYNTVLTGTWVNKHNVWDNDIAAPNYNYPTIFRLFKDQYPDRKIAVFSSWLDNRTKLVGDGLAATRNIKVDHHFDGLELDTVNYPHDRDAAYMKKIDDAVVDHAAAFIRSDGPDLSWVYLEYTDDMGHRYGDGKRYYDAIEHMDEQVGRIWRAIVERRKQTGEDWQIYITTDHGRDSATGRNHGGQSDREKLAWIVTNASGLNGHFRDGSASQADIMPSIARFLEISIPESVKREIDGTSLIGKISISDARAVVAGDQVLISWSPRNRKGKVKVFVSNTNQFKSGSVDDYRLLRTVKVSAGQIRIPFSEVGADFSKFVLEAPHNTLNRWLMSQKQNLEVR